MSAYLVRSADRKWWMAQRKDGMEEKKKKKS